MIETIEQYIMLFFIYSFMGWFMESVGGILNVKKFVNRGFLIGPYCPVYGVGVVLATILLEKYIGDTITLFFLAVLICGILEYSTGYVMEKCFNARWWDYSKNKFNINGRVCLETLIPFGILATFFLSKANPFFISIFEKIPDIAIHIFSAVFSILFLIDVIVSFKIIWSFKDEIYANKDNTEEIVEKVKDKTEDVIMKAESDAIYYSRKLKLKTQRKMRYKRKRIEEAIELSIKDLADKIENRRKEVDIRIKERKESIIKEIKAKKEEFNKRYDSSKRVVEEFKKQSLLTKRLMEAFPKIEIKEIKKKKKK